MITENNISLRDHFAGVSLQGLLASPVMGDCALHDSAAEWVKELTECAYDFADAMLERREKKVEAQRLLDEQAMLDKVLDETMEDCDITTRSLNGLKAINVITIRDLCNCTELDLRGATGLGKKSIYEIKEVLFQRGLYLKDGQFWGYQREHFTYYTV